MKRKEFLASLGLLGVAPKLLSKKATVAENAIIPIDKDSQPKITQGNLNEVKLTIDGASLVERLKHNDLVWIKSINGKEILIEGIIKNIISYGAGITIIDVYIIRLVNQYRLSKNEDTILYHASRVDGKHYHVNFSATVLKVNYI